MNVNKIPFLKMNGCGNDFIVVDNREDIMSGIDIPGFVRRICARRVSVGADGFIMVEKFNKADFKMRYFNADGSEGEMCGNGARCAAMFAFLIGAAGDEMRFETISGTYEAKIRDGNVLLKFLTLKKDNFLLNKKHEFGGRVREYCYAHVGVPHVILFEKGVNGWDDKELIALGREVRYCTDLFPDGANVNFVEVIDEHHIFIRTYERGVEDETYACGTGATATAIVAGLLGKVKQPVDLLSKGGPLTVHYRIEENAIVNVYLEGDAKAVVEGFVLPDAWK